jgi:hypothetical protein
VGDTVRAGTVGGGPGSATGDLLCIDLCEGVGAFMILTARGQCYKASPAQGRCIPNNTGMPFIRVRMY